MAGIRGSVWLLLAALLLASPVAAQDAAPVAPTAEQANSPAAPTKPLPPADQARAVLEKHCARCHQAGHPQRDAGAGSFGGILDLDGLARRGLMVQPGQPDASPLYTILLSGHANYTPRALGDSTPTPDEIDAIRIWISELQPNRQDCPNRRRIGLHDIAQALRRLEEPGGEALKGIRFISLARDHNRCGTVDDMADAHRSVQKLMMTLRTTLVEIELPFAADDVPLVAVRLGDLGWHPAQWDALAAESGAPILTDARLARVYGTTTPVIDGASLSVAADALNLGFVSYYFYRDGGTGTPLQGDADMHNLAMQGRSDVTLDIAAADLGVPATDLGAILDKISGAAEPMARSLRQGPISEWDWRQLRPQLDVPGADGVLRYSPEALGRPAPAIVDALAVKLWSDKLTYSKGDLVVLTAQANQECHLTVINVDTRGEATVLYPSDSDPDNAVKPSVKVRIPSEMEPYQLRTNDAGTETFIAICNTARKRLTGIEQDFETQRFSLLGDWRQFLKTAAMREALIARKEPARRRRSRRAKAEVTAPSTPPPEREARTAIYVKVE